ncbi:MAG: CBS domain-containing protein [Pontiellaceae bacterium]|nr:CBS domain-containing protein [Pontiellaceae bacterium]
MMQTRVVTVEMDDTLHVVKTIFDHTRFHHLLVIENNRLKGVLSDRDLLKALSPNIGTAAELPRDSATLNKRVHQIMSRKPITLPPEATVEEAGQLMIAHRISCIPVVNALHEIRGILTWRDLLPELFDTNSAL